MVFTKKQESGKTLRIAYVNVVGPLGWHRFLYKQCRGLAQKNYKVFLYTRAEKEQMQYDVQIKPVPEAKRRPFRFFKTIGLLYPLKHGHYEIITIVNPELLPMAFLLRVFTRAKIVFDCQEAWADFMRQKPYLGPVRKRMMYYVMKALLKMSQWFLHGIIVSDENILKDFKNIPSDRIVCFHNYPWFSMFPEPIEWFRREYDIGYPGTLSRTAGLFQILDVIGLLKSDHPEIRALIIGDIPSELKEEVQRVILKYDIRDNIQFHEFIPYDQIPKELSNCKVGLVTLQNLPKFHKNIAGKIFDYMACGIPVVSADLPPERPYIINSKNGYLVPPEDAKAMADAVHTILTDNEKGRKMAEQSKAFFLEKGWYAEKEIESLDRFFQKIING
jgi:glycosyltransferase involved in cell wall biosynthesis